MMILNDSLVRFSRLLDDYRGFKNFRNTACLFKGASRRCCWNKWQILYKILKKQVAMFVQDHF